MLKLKRVHKDKRGEIYVLSVVGKELTFLITKKGYARGGCVHKINHENVFVLSGKIKYVIKGVHKNNNIYKQICDEGARAETFKGTPHYFVSLTDSIVMEWGATKAEKDKKYKPFRDIVNKINEKNTTN